MSESRHLSDQQLKEALLNLQARKQFERLTAPSYFNGWIPKPHYDWSDLGCGRNYVRAGFMANQHKEWNLLGIDIELDSTRAQDHIELVRGQLHETLERLVDGSVGVFNDDYCLTDVPYEYALRLLPIMAQKIQAGGNLLISYRKQAEGYVAGTLNVAGMLAPHGFEIVSSRPYEEAELDLSPQSKEEMRVKRGIEAFKKGKPIPLPVEVEMSDMQQEYIANPGLYTPMRLTAKLAR